MTSVQGRDTDGFGQWLTAYVAGSPASLGYRVFYDHGDSSLENVAAIKGFYGDAVTNTNRLADVDVMVVSRSGEIVLLVEIEERASSPKKVFGDAVTILMCNRFAVGRGKRQEYFEVTEATSLLISGVMPDRGNRIRKIHEIAAPRFRAFGGVEGGILPGNVNFVFGPSIEAVTSHLKQVVTTLRPG